MNARTQTFELSIEGKQTDEALASIFHTVLFHRTLGKFVYSDMDKYKIGSIGYTDVDCDYIDLTYVCCSSAELDRNIKKEISMFSEQLRINEAVGYNAGQISLEFFERRPQRWLLQQDCIPWEVWTVRLELISMANEQERFNCREKVGELIADKVFYIAEVINNQDNYTPKIPKQSELDFIFDTAYDDIQPYLFKFNYSLNGPSRAISLGSSVKKLIRDTLIH